MNRLVLGATISSPHSWNQAYALSTVILTHLSQPTHGLEVIFTKTNKNLFSWSLYSQ